MSIIYNNLKGRIECIYNILDDDNAVYPEDSEGSLIISSEGKSLALKTSNYPPRPANCG